MRKGRDSLISDRTLIPQGCQFDSCRRFVARKIGHVSRNGLSVDLLNGVPKSNHVTARGFRRTAGRVLGEFCVVRA